MTTQYIDNNSLLKLFKNVNLFEIIEIKEIKENKSKRKIKENNLKRKIEDEDYDSYNPKRIKENEKTESSQESLIMTPLSKSIYETATTTEKKRLLHDFQLDDEIINIINEMETDKDYIYEDDLPGSIGFFLESWVTLNYKCPVCDQFTLRKYVISNMPVVDLVCINKDHKIEHGVKFFQVKSSSTDGYFKKTDISAGFIHVGSKRFGYNAHIIKSTESNDIKKILVGYICINYFNSEKQNIMIINKKKSFVLLPNTKINTIDESYYFYYDIPNKNVIGWNNILVNQHIFNPSFNTFDNSTQYNEKQINNNIFAKTSKYKLIF